MEPLVYVVAAVLVIILILLVTVLKKSSAKRTEDGDGDGNNVPVHVAPTPGRAVERAGGVRRRRRMVPRARPDAEEDFDDEDGAEPGDEVDDVTFDESGVPKKMGAKKLKKLQDKAERRQMREAEEEERRERKERTKLLEEQEKQAGERRKAEEALEAEEEAKRKEEQERREHEEYLKLKEAFTVEEEGTHEAELNQDTESLLQEFINYIKDMKVVMLEDLAAHFKMKTQDTIDRINTLLDESRLSGVLDDRGKFIYITNDEYQAVAKFIKQRGRVSITELAESSNQLINLNPENLDTHRKLVAEVS